jgi:hypothetical protein
MALAGIFAYILLMPLELRIDSYKGLYCLRMGILAQASVESDPLEVLRLHLKVLFLDFYWLPSEISSRGHDTKKKPKKKTHSGKTPRMTMARVQRLLRSFKVKAFRLELDTGNPVLNARLFPLFFLLGQGSGGINFQGRNHILLHLVNRPIHILNAFINLKT